MGDQFHCVSAEAPLSSLFLKADILYPSGYEGLITLSMSAEPNLSIVCACIPTIKLCFRRSAPDIISREEETSIDQTYFQQKAELGSEDRAVEMPPETRAHGAYELSTDQEIREMPMTARYEAP